MDLDGLERDDIVVELMLLNKSLCRAGREYEPEYESSSYFMYL